MLKRPNFVRYLLSEGFDKDAVDEKGETLLYRSLEHSQPDLAKYILSIGADPSKGKSNIFHPVIISSYVDIYNQLISLGADPFAKNYCPFCIAYCCVEIMKHLLSIGANINERDEYGDTALMMACHSNYEHNIPGINFLLKNGANVNLRNREGKTAYDLIRDDKFGTKRKLIKAGYKKDCRIC